MKSFKIFGLLAVAAAVLMAFAAGTASATLTSPAGTPYTGNIVATSTNSELDAAVDVKCANSTVEVDPSGAGATSGVISALSFTNCGSDTVTVLKKGSFSLSSSGSFRVAGLEITTQLHRSVFGFPITTHCIYGTIVISTNVASLTEGVAPAQFHFFSPSQIPYATLTDSACEGSGLGWTGTYTVSTPPTAIVVD